MTKRRMAFGRMSGWCVGLLAVLWASVATAGTVIVAQPDAPWRVRLGAREVQRYVYLRTGELVPIVAEQPAGEEAIVLEVGDGTAGAPAYQITTSGAAGRRIVRIVGTDDVGVLWGAYRFAELLDVRFYLHGDVVPDERTDLHLPVVNETGKPLFAVRGILPFHDFPEGPDWWSLDDYKAHISQMAKLRMNFIGLHCYPEGGAGPEPTVWIGLAEDVKDNGDVRHAYPAEYASTMRDGAWGYRRKATGEYAFGADRLFETDAYGPEVMDGRLPHADDPAGQVEVFNRTAALLREAFEHAKRLGIQTCVGTETPLVAPEAVKQRVISLGLPPDSPQTLQKLYEGMFRRIERAYPVDWYWLWTPEHWTWKGHGPTQEQIAATVDDLKRAIAAAGAVGASFKLATCGWVLGPEHDRALFDRLLPAGAAMSCINREVGFELVDPGLASVSDRPRWAIPWLEDDPALIVPQLWAGRVRRDAADALAYGCNGLLGIHWRTRPLGPMFTALAEAGWEQEPWNANPGEPPNGQLRDMPVDDLYLDWATSQFGPRAAKEIAAIFIRLDGIKGHHVWERQTNLPRPSTWDHGPGGIQLDSRPWEQVAGGYAFVDELAALRPRVTGLGNIERFEYWLHQFRYLKAVGHLACDWAAYLEAEKKVNEVEDVEARRRAAVGLLPLRRALIDDLAVVHEHLLATVSTPGEMGTVDNWQRHVMPILLDEPGERLAAWLGEALPAEAHPDRRYRGRPRLFVPTVRSALDAGEPLRLKAVLLAEADNHPVQVSVQWRPMGQGKFERQHLSHLGRGVYSEELVLGQHKAVEYYLEARMLPAGQVLRWPATAPRLNQTVVVWPDTKPRHQ